MTTPSKPGAGNARETHGNAQESTETHGDAVLSEDVVRLTCDAMEDCGIGGMARALRAHDAALRERARQAEEARAAAQSVNILKDAENARLRERVAALEAQAEADAAAMKSAKAVCVAAERSALDEGDKRGAALIRGVYASLESRLAAREG